MDAPRPRVSRFSTAGQGERRLWERDWGKNSISPESLLATKPLTKEPEDSGYEIVATKGVVLRDNMIVVTMRDFGVSSECNASCACAV